MNTPQPIFLSSAIPYVNAAPHLGHALELVQSDALARYQQARGRDLFFSSGTDDNSLKNVRAAALAHTTPRELVARHGADFVRLAETLDVTPNDFIQAMKHACSPPASKEFLDLAAERQRFHPIPTPNRTAIRIRSRVRRRRRPVSAGQSP